MSTITRRVAAGAAFLDQEIPGWDRLIDLDRLDIGSGCRCVLGQINRNEDNPALSYDLGMTVLGLDDRDSGTLGVNGDRRDLYALTDEWRAVIAARREAAAA